jgi:hypothetical protein
MNLHFKKGTSGLYGLDSGIDVRKCPGVGNNLYPFQAMIPSGI